MDPSTQQQIDQIKQNADYQKQRIDEQTAQQIQQVIDAEAQRKADEIRQQGQNELNQIGK